MNIVVRFLSRISVCVIVLLLACSVGTDTASAQCAVTPGPGYAHSCSNEYFDSIIVSGTGVTSTVSVLGITSCRGTFMNDYALQGSTAPSGSIVSLYVARPALYQAYLSVYVDWNNDGSYSSSELAGTMLSLSPATGDTTYNFTVPSSGIVSGTNLHMRVMLSEDSTGAPCTGSYGQTYDFFFIVGSGCTMPVLSFRPSSNDTVSNCPGGTGVTLAASGVGIGGTFTWSPASGLSSTTGGLVTANPATTTVYTVAGTSTGTCTATFLDTVTVISTGKPADTISFLGSGKFCMGDTITLTGTTGTDYTYHWFLNGVAVRGRTNNYLAGAPGSYTLVVSAYGCTDTSAPVTLSFNPVPTPVIAFDGKAFHTAAGFASYQWSKNGAPVSGATYDSLAAGSDGIYDVVVTDSIGCTGTASVYTLNRVGIANINYTSSILIYPNPASSTIHILSPVSVTGVIKGIDGKIVTAQANAQDIDVSRLSPGMYFVEIFDESGHRLSVQEFVKY